MNEELKAKLKAKLLGAGLKEALLSFVTVEKEEQIEVVIEKLKGLAPEPQQPTLEELIQRQDIRSHFDKKMTDALNKKKPKQGSEPKKEGEKSIADIVAEAVSAATNPLMEKLNGFEQQRTGEQKTSLAMELLGKTTIPEQHRERYLKSFDPTSEVKIEDQVKTMETDYNDFKQSIIDSSPLAGAPPLNGGKVSKISPEEAAKIVERARV